VPPITILCEPREIKSTRTLIAPGGESGENEKQSGLPGLRNAVINARFIGDESARRRFVSEARAAASVRHPNVASVFHLGKSGDSYFYAMEFVDGESLDKVIRRSGRLEPSTALKVTALVAAGLEAIDRQNLVHRDIKPSNIMVSMHGDNIANAKIIDLGLAKGTVADDSSISEISIQGAFAGTPTYASPEQFSGVGADIRSDLYSLGKQRRAQETVVWARRQNDAGHKLDPRILAPESANPGSEDSSSTPADAWPITALLFLEAHDLSEAAQVAESHPALHYGSKVEVRPWAAPVPLQ
jgi:serine/threonine protein kinase